MGPCFYVNRIPVKRRRNFSPVKSKFGYHIIQMVQRNGDDAIVRHILRIPPVTEAEIKQAKTKLDTVGQKLLPEQSVLMKQLLNTVMMNQQNLPGLSYQQRWFYLCYY